MAARKAGAKPAALKRHHRRAHSQDEELQRLSEHALAGVIEVAAEAEGLEQIAAAAEDRRVLSRRVSSQLSV